MIRFGDEYPSLARMTSLGKGALPEHLGIAFDVIGDDWVRCRMSRDAQIRGHSGDSMAAPR